MQRVQRVKGLEAVSRGTLENFVVERLALARGLNRGRKRESARTNLLSLSLSLLRLLPISTICQTQKRLSSPLFPSFRLLISRPPPPPSPAERLPHRFQPWLCGFILAPFLCARAAQECRVFTKKIASLCGREPRQWSRGGGDRKLARL